MKFKKYLIKDPIQSENIIHNLREDIDNTHINKEPEYSIT